MKKLMIFIITILSVCSLAFGLVGCGDKSDEVVNFELTRKEIGLEKYASANLLKSVDGDASLIEWESDDEDICTVSNGIVEAIGEGEAEITASSPSMEASCKITVKPTKKIPLMVVDKRDITLKVDTGVTINPSVLFASAVKPASFTFTSSDKDVCKVDENGLVTAVGLGEAQITIIGKYVDVQFSKTVSVKVIDNTDIALNAYTVDLYLNNVINPGQTTHQISASVRYNDADVSATASYETADSKIAVVDNNGKISAVGVGSTTITAKYTVNDIEYAENVNVFISKSVANIAISEFEVYQSAQGNSPIANNVEIDVSKYNLSQEDKNSKVITVITPEKTWKATNRVNVSYTEDACLVSGREFGGNVYGEGIGLKYETNTVIINVEIGNVITKKIASKKDLENMPLFGGLNKQSAGMIYNGYFVMTRNIDLVAEEQVEANKGKLLNRVAGTDYKTSGREDSSTMDWGFIGTFDGMGYTISNLITTNKGGTLFGNVHKEGTVKNLGLKDAILTQAGDGYVTLLANNFSGKLTNCYIDVSVSEHANAATHIAPIARNIARAVIKDVVIKIDLSNFVIDKGVASVCAIKVLNLQFWMDKPTLDTVCIYRTNNDEEGLAKIDFGKSINGANEATNSISTDLCVQYGYTEVGIAEVSDTTYWTNSNGQTVFTTAVE